MKNRICSENGMKRELTEASLKEKLLKFSTTIWQKIEDLVLKTSSFTTTTL